jgi:hypothetical protein
MEIYDNHTPAKVKTIGKFKQYLNWCISMHIPVPKGVMEWVIERENIETAHAMMVQAVIK